MESNFPKKLFILFSIGLFYFPACSERHGNVISEADHVQEIEEWVNERTASLKKENGWLNLIGLHWITADTTRMGSSEENDFTIKSDSFPSSLGYFVKEESELVFYPQTEGIYSVDQQVSSPISVFSEKQEESAKPLSFQSFRWTIIKRGDALGIRLRDLEAPAVKEFKEIDRFPTNLTWRLQGTFTPYIPVKEIVITNVVGQTSVNLSPGFVSFEKDGKSYQLDALDAGSQLYLILADASSGLQTYGGGRYLYIEKPNQDRNDVVIDFNKAYNPPCVFTPYATCPLPPKQNILDVYIEAGEKYTEK
ncbi:DUF1684 domain-containing protein [Mongoliitalea daihaiensis]|uniref:DUF1684 domain-containing protein n=1 Tax=Mongoliitalea daihaiensis TaxID=2782006 RepID=UPI001F419225|nr:DUF1684 domain-containing protein [Mongoliitalea daihaiensis]UJP63429.1 DUF1684 domain-containing protein [Mongoliitalea daihaiensis]